MTKHLRPALALALSLVFVLSVAACGDDDEDGGGSGASTTSAETESGSADSGSSDVVAAAKAAVEEGKQPVTEWSGPAEAPPPVKDKTVHIISCSPDTEGCQRHVTAAVDAAEAIGWKPVLTQTNGTPQEFVQRMNEAIDVGADAIIGGSFPIAAIREPLKRAAKEGVPVVTMIGGNETPAYEEGFKGGFYADVDTNNRTLGEMIGNWVVAQTDGQAKIGILNEADFPVLQTRIAGFKDAFEKCPDCEIKEILNVPVSVLAKDGTPTVSQFIRANPDVNYFFSVYDGGAVFAVQGIKEVGKGDDVPLASIDANQPNFAFIREGDVQEATSGASHEMIGWAAIDQLNRAFNGEAPAEEWNPNSDGIPPKLMDETNLPPEGESFTGDYDFEVEFKKLWGVQ